MSNSKQGLPEIETAAVRQTPAVSEAVGSGAERPRGRSGQARNGKGSRISATVAGQRILGPMRPIPVTDLVCRDDRDGASDPEKFRELVQNIGNLGPIHPLVVTWDVNIKKWEIVSGRRRYRAVEKLNEAALAGGAKTPPFPELPCRALEGAAEPGLDQVIALTENRMREEENLLSQAKKMKVILEATRWSQTELARNLGMSKSTVCECLQLLTLPQEEQDRIRSGADAFRTLRGFQGRRKVSRRSAAEHHAFTGNRDRGGEATHVYPGLTRPDGEASLVFTVSGHSAQEPSTENLIFALKRWLRLLESQSRCGN